MANLLKVKKPFVVLCLEGCHGSGKTALTMEFKRLGFPILDEGFLDQPVSLLHPQSLFMESVWTTKWFLRLMEHIGKLQDADDKAGSSNEPQIIIADRSPLSAVFYSKTDGHLLEPLIRQYVKELREAADVHIITVHLHTQRELLWSRILKRLELEPSRKQYAEDKREWMEKVCSFYESMAWDVTIHNNTNPIPTLAAELLAAAGKKHPDVRAAVHACAARTGIDLPDNSTAPASSDLLSLDVPIKAADLPAAPAAPAVPSKLSASLRLGRSPSVEGDALEPELLSASAAADDEDDEDAENDENGLRSPGSGAGHSSSSSAENPLPSTTTPFKARSTNSGAGNEVSPTSAAHITAPSPVDSLIPRMASITAE